MEAVAKVILVDPELHGAFVGIFRVTGNAYIIGIFYINESLSNSIGGEW